MIARAFVRFCFCAIVSVGVSVGIPGGLCAQNAVPAIKLQAARIVVAGANAPANERDHVARKWVRGLIQ
ncbi:MAG: hypothetical protein ACOVOJ_13745, partial [Pirellula sp.]